MHNEPICSLAQLSGVIRVSEFDLHIIIFTGSLLFLLSFHKFMFARVIVARLQKLAERV